MKSLGLLSFLLSVSISYSLQLRLGILPSISRRDVTKPAMVNGTETATKSTETHIGLPAFWPFSMQAEKPNSGKTKSEDQTPLHLESPSVDTSSDHPGSPDDSENAITDEEDGAAGSSSSEESKENDNKGGWSKTATRVGLMSVLAGLFYLLYLQKGSADESFTGHGLLNTVNEGGLKDQFVHPATGQPNTNPSSAHIEVSNSQNGNVSSWTTNTTVTYVPPRHEPLMVSSTGSSLSSNYTRPGPSVAEGFYIVGKK